MSDGAASPLEELLEECTDSLVLSGWPFRVTVLFEDELERTEYVE